MEIGAAGAQGADVASVEAVDKVKALLGTEGGILATDGVLVDTIVCGAGGVLEMVGVSV